MTTNPSLPLEPVTVIYFPTLVTRVIIYLIALLIYSSYPRTYPISVISYQDLIYLPLELPYVGLNIFPVISIQLPLDFYNPLP